MTMVFKALILGLLFGFVTKEVLAQTSMFLVC